MKPSRFNIIFDVENGKKLAFNSASAALAEIESDKWPIVHKFLVDPGAPATTESEKEVYQAMCQGRYLIDDDHDEMTQLKVRNCQQRFGRREHTLTICPTLACNFRCDYCYESQSPLRMNQETEKALLKFSEKRIRAADGIGLVWFGGEPTLCLGTIERLQKGYQNLAAKHGATLHASSIITNGYLLDGAMAERLKSWGVEIVQITIDGPEKIHDSRRKLVNGGGTYARIIDNLKESAGILRIAIRINVDRRNYGQTWEVLQELDRREILNKLEVYFAQVTPSTGVCADMREQCMSTFEFSQTQLNLYRELMSKGYYQVQYPSLAGGGHCAADTDDTFVVSPTGALFKCWEEIAIDDEESVGSLDSEVMLPHQRNRSERYLAWDPLSLKECRECSILPMCMGGCPHAAVFKNNSERGECCSWKYNLQEMLKLRYESNEKKAAASAQ